MKEQAQDLEKLKRDTLAALDHAKLRADQLQEATAAREAIVQHATVFDLPALPRGVSPKGRPFALSEHWQICNGADKKQAKKALAREAKADRQFKDALRAAYYLLYRRALKEIDAADDPDFWAAVLPKFCAVPV